ncbi:unnamed protein product [Nezara viridula]|uniref:Uncharacterized protein n=1 Tax=Nezara viridula TaxID=85310 RepID=A0A9P0HIK1_NEZVI|nr:unnamed protein product [Nezara viridula]
MTMTEFARPRLGSVSHLGNTFCDFRYRILIGMEVSIFPFHLEFLFNN